MKLTIELDTEENGHIIAEVLELPGVLVYGQNEKEAITKVQALALRVLAERVEHGEAKEEILTLFRLPTAGSSVES